MRRTRRLAVSWSSGRVVLALAAVALCCAAVADAQIATKRARVGIIGSGPNPADIRPMFIRGLAELGYTEGQHVELTEYHADDVPSRLPGIASEVVRSMPHVVFARGPAATAVMANATTTIPIVAVDLESDPVARGFAKTLGRPGTNVTGVFMDLPEMSAKQLQLLREIVPGLSRVALLGDLKSNATQFEATRRAARTFGMETAAYDVRAAADIEPTLDMARRAGMGAVIAFSSPLVFRNSARLAAISHEKRIPGVSLFTQFADAGGLLSYGPNLGDAFRRSGIYVAKVLAGIPPADLPIERPQRFELVVNLKTAKALGLTVPASLLARAERVIE